MIDRSWILTAGLALALGCDPGGGGGEEGGGESRGPTASTGAEGGEGGESGESGEGGEMGPWEELAFGHGLMQTVGTEAGLWIEREGAVLPAECDAILTAAEGSDGLAWATSSGEPGGGDGGSDDPVPGSSDLLDDASLAARPGLGVEPSPVYAVTVHGQIADSAPAAEYPRVIQLENSGGADHLVYLDVCETAELRGQCYAPTAQFPFDGCIGVPSELPGFILGDTAISNEDGSWSLGLSGSYECDTDIAVNSHPEDWPLGDQEVEIAAGDLPEGVPVEITDDMLTWRSSYRAEVECEEIPDLGPVCTCTWDYREAFEIERGSMVREGDTVHIDLKGAVGDDAYLLWGRFPIAP